QQLEAEQAIDAQAPITRAGWRWLGPDYIGGRVRSLIIDRTNPSKMFVGSVSGGIWRSDDAARSWRPVDDFMANLAVTAMAMDPTNPNIMYAGTGEGYRNYDAVKGAGIFKSTDGGI